MQDATTNPLAFPSASLPVVDDPLTDVLRRGAHQLLVQAIEAEVVWSKNPNEVKYCRCGNMALTNWGDVAGHWWSGRGLRMAIERSARTCGAMNATSNVRPRDLTPNGDRRSLACRPNAGGDRCEPDWVTRRFTAPRVPVSRSPSGLY
ncbi:MAG: hypothetical protein GMKNLPBB_03321 [Myxococcota bacterium]|nr:hypothetical protein [Myxococcota bacterium]